MIVVQVYSRASVEHPERCEDETLVLVREGSAPVFSVIDGMGGHQHQNANGTTITGREAAQHIREVLIEDLATLPPDVDASSDGLAQQRVTATIARAHDEVRRTLNGGTLPEHNRVGAVLTVVIVCEMGNRLLVAQVGDTRAYLFSGGELIQLCEDEDNIEYLIRQGRLSVEDGEHLAAILNTYDGITEPAVNSTVTINNQTYPLYLAWRWFISGNAALDIPSSNVVINALGIHEEAPSPQLSRIEVTSGDLLLLLSDGIYKNVNEAEIIATLQTIGDHANALGEMAFARSQDSTNRRMTPDDVSALVIQF